MPSKKTLPKKKSYDSLYVSKEQHEIDFICDMWTDDNGDYLPSTWLYYQLHLMSLGGKRKVERKKLYSILKTMRFFVRDLKKGK